MTDSHRVPVRWRDLPEEGRDVWQERHGIRPVDDAARGEARIDGGAKTWK